MQRLTTSLLNMRSINSFEWYKTAEIDVHFSILLNEVMQMTVQHGEFWDILST